MASTWSALKIELLETGQNPGQWGNLTNVNLGDAVLGEAITGQATVDFASDADVTITLTDSATTQAARNLRLNITESSTGIGSVRNLILGSGCQIEKFYLINNTGTGAKTVKNTSGTGISVPAGKATLVFNNGTNVVDAASYFSSLTLGSALPVASGGTGVTTSTGTTNVVLSNSPTLVTPVLGVATATSLQGIIGNVTPAAGAFTTLSSTSGATIQGLTVGYGAGNVNTSTAVGYQAALLSTTSNSVSVGYQAHYRNLTGNNSVAIGYQALYGGASADADGCVAVGHEALLNVTTGDFNVALGMGTLRVTSSGANNVAVGYLALNGNTTASNNTAVGYQALYTNTESANTAVGYQAGYNNAGGDYFTAVGYQAGKGNTSGRFNTAVGRDALLTNSTGAENVAVGKAALNLVTTSGNTAVGSNCLGVATTGAGNTGIGSNALTRHTIGSNNVGVGIDALQASTTASQNVAVGYQASYSTDTGIVNTAIGSQAGYSNVTSNSNVFVGNSSGYLTTSAANTFIGKDSGYAVTTGAKNTILGRYDGNQDGLDIRTLSNYAVISDGDGNRLISTANGQTLALDSAVPNSGTGITFPASLSASSNANTLDDYEEGIWTPTIVGGYTGVTYTAQNGWYTKVGRSVVISGRVLFSGTANSTGISVGGLPFSQGNLGGGAYGGGGVPYTTVSVITNTSPYVSGNTVEYYTMGTGVQIASSGNVSGVWLSFVISISTD